jgi:hypothetical protein
MGDWDIFKTVMTLAQQRAAEERQIQREQESNQGTAKFLQDYVTGLREPEYTPGVGGAMSKILKTQPVDPTVDTQSDFSTSPQEVVDAGVNSSQNVLKGNRRLDSLSNALQAISSGQSKMPVSSISPFITSAVQKLDEPEQTARELAKAAFLEKIKAHSVAPGAALIQNGVPVYTNPKEKDFKEKLMEKYFPQGLPQGETGPDPFSSIPHSVRKLLGVDTTSDAEETKRAGFEAVYPQFKGKLGTSEYANAFRDYTNKTAEKLQINVAGSQARGASYANERFYSVVDTQDVSEKYPGGTPRQVKGIDINKDPGRYIPASADVELAGQRSRERSTGGAQATAAAAASYTYNREAPELIELRNKVHAKGLLPTNIRTIEGIQQWAGTESSDPDTALLKKKTIMISDALQRVMGQQGGEWAYKAAMDILDPRLAPKAYENIVLSHGKTLERTAFARQNPNKTKVANPDVQQPQLENPPTEADINATAIKYKMTPQQVKQKLGIQ